MISQLSILVLAATLGQGPAGPAWLNAVPPEADVVVHVRGLTAVKDDVVAMLKAMSPALGAQAAPALEQAVATARAQTDEHAVVEPFVVIIRAVAPEEPGAPPFAVMYKAPEYEPVLRSVAGGKDPEIKHLDAGYDSFNGPEGKTWFAVKTAGGVAFGPDRALIFGISKPGGKTLGKTMPARLQKPFLAGDVGVYVNVAALTARYAEPIAQAKQQLLASFDQLGPQMGKGMVDFLKSMYGKMFDTAEEADALVMGVEFGGEGLAVSGVVSVKAGSASSKAMARMQTTDGAALAKLPADSGYYVSMNLDAKTFQAFQMMAMQMLTPGGKPSPDLEATIAKERGRIETISSVSIGQGIKSFEVTTLSDPKSFVAAYQGMIALMQRPDSPVTFYKDVMITPDAQTYRGFAYTRIEMTFDFDKLAKLQPNNPAVVPMMKAMYGGDKITTWLGVSDTQMIKVIAPTWSDAQAQIDGYFKGDDGIGGAAGFKTTRARMPKETTVLFMMSAQGLVRQLTAQFSAMIPNGPKGAPADLPKEPAFIGFSLAPAGPNAMGFELFVPSSVGPVVEKGLVPVLSGMRPPVNN